MPFSFFVVFLLFEAGGGQGEQFGGGGQVPVIPMSG
jgi:hypothetical protein